MNHSTPFSFLALLLAALFLSISSMTAPAQTADPLLFSARFERSPGAAGQPDDVLLKWESSAGYRDVLEATTDLLTWSPVIQPLCGYGQTWSVSVPDARFTPGTGSGQYIPVYSYSQRRYADGSLMLTWTAGGIPWRKNFPASSDWAQMAWSGAIDYLKNDPPLVPWRIWVINFTANPNATPFPESTNLTPEAQAYLDRLLSLEDDIADVIAAGPPTPGPQNAGTASNGQRALYRVRREVLDADDDLLIDCLEMNSGFSDETKADTDGDGILDTDEDFDSDGHTNYKELAHGSRLTAANPQALNYPGLATETNLLYPLISFAAWRDTRLPYRYNIVERLGGGPWQDINPYTQLRPAYTQPADTSGMDSLTFRANTPLFTDPTVQLGVQIRPRWPAHALKHPAGPVRRADWKAHNNAHIDSLIPANEFGRNIFDEYTPHGNCKWARWCWTNQLNFSGVSFSDGNHNPNGIPRLNTGGYPFIISANRDGTTATFTTVTPHQLTLGTTVTIKLVSGPTGFAALRGTWSVVSTPTPQTFTCTTSTTGTIPLGATVGEVVDPAATPQWTYHKWECASEVVMVTPIHGIFTAHWRGNLPLGRAVVFHDREGKRVVRTIIKRSPYWNLTPEQTQLAAPYDLGVVELDSPVPEGVKVYKTFEITTAAGSPGAEFFGAKVIMTSREMEAFPYQSIYYLPVFTPEEVAPIMTYLSLASPPGTSPFYQLPDRAHGPNYVIGGDSGGPVFIFYKGEQIFVGMLKSSGAIYPYTGASNSFLPGPAVMADVQAKIDAMSTGYPIQTLSLDP